MECSKWIATIASIWIQCSVGASYAFGVYSPVLKSSQGYDQSTLNFVAVFKDIGANAGLLSGLLYSAVVVSKHSRSSSWIARFGGPWVVITAGAVQCFSGYFFIWLAVTGSIPRPPVPLMCLFMFLATHAQTFYATANIVTSVRNFPDYGGTIVGIVKGFLGLSGAILVKVYQTIFHDKPSSFVLLLALLPTLVPLLLMPFIRIYETRGPDEKKHLNGLSLIALLISAYLMIVIILEHTITFGSSARIVTLVVLLLGVASPIGIAVRAHIEDSPKSLSRSSTSSLDEAPLLISHDPVLYHNIYLQEPPITHLDSSTVDICEPQLNLLQALKTIEFWLLFSAMACGLGSGMATVNNISQIGGSLGYTSIQTTTLVSLWSIWNFLGRIGAGYISDYFLHQRCYARPLFMAITLGIMGIGHLIIATGWPGALYIGSTVVGVCYGSQWSLMPTISSEVFGVVNLGTIFNTIAIASPVGSYILSVWIVGFIYDKEASLDQSGGNTCSGPSCFMLSFMIMAMVSILGSSMSLGLYFRTRGFYKKVIYERLQRSFRL